MVSLVVLVSLMGLLNLRSIGEEGVKHNRVKLVECET